MKEKDWYSFSAEGQTVNMLDLSAMGSLLYLLCSVRAPEAALDCRMSNPWA